MDCEPKIPGQIVPTPLFPDGRGEIIKVLLPSKECNIESNYLNELIKSTIKKNKPKIDCQKPQKSNITTSNSNSNNSDPNSINNYPPGTITEIPPGSPIIPPKLPPGLTNPKIPGSYPSEELNWYLCRHEVNIANIFLPTPDGHTINYYWVWLLAKEPPLKIIRSVTPTDLTPNSEASVTSSFGYYNSLFLSQDKITELANQDLLSPYSSYQCWDIIHVTQYEHIYAQGSAHAFITLRNLGIFNRDITWGSLSDVAIKNSGLTLEEIESLIVRRFPYIPNIGTYPAYYFDGYYIAHIGYSNITLFNYFVISPTSGRKIWTGTANRVYSIISAPLDNSLRTQRRWFVNGLPGYYDDIAETPPDNIQGDNGVSKDDCCCDCVEAVASVMEAYMERISPMFDDLKQYINVKIKEQSNDLKEYLDKQLLQQSEFIQKQILEIDDQQIDFTPVINQIKTTEQNLWTGANLSINSDELPKEKNK